MVFSSSSGQDRISPFNIYKISSGQVIRMKKMKIRRVLVDPMQILRTYIWRVVIKDVNQWMTQTNSEKKNSECSRYQDH